MKIYKAKTLFSGSVIGKVGSYAAAPDHFKGQPFIIEHDGKLMRVEDWEKADGFRVFADKFNREKNYTLGYFEWKPNGILQERSTNETKM